MSPSSSRRAAVGLSKAPAAAPESGRVPNTALDTVPTLMLSDGPATEAMSAEMKTAEMELDSLLAKARAAAGEPSSRVRMDSSHHQVAKTNLLNLYESVGPVASFSLLRGTASGIHNSQERATQAVQRFHGTPVHGELVYLRLPSVARTKTKYITGVVFWNEVHDDLRDITHTHTGEVRRDFQFREGNYDVPFAALKRTLEAFGLWERVTQPDFPGKPIGDWQNQAQNAWALEQIRSFVCTSFSNRWAIADPISGYQLLKALREGCQVFRFMDLSPELRLSIYDCMTEKWKKWIACETWPDIGDFSLSKARFPFRKPLLQVLSSVSREFRRNITELYSSRGKFFLDCIDNLNFLKDIDDWVSKVGMWRLRHLRHLYVHGMYSCQEFHLEVTFCPKAGLEARCSRRTDFDNDITDRVNVSAYLAMLVQRKLAENWESTGVIEFFTADQDALHLAISGYCESDSE